MIARKLPQTIDFDKAVHEGKQILQQASAGQWRLGELADKLEPKYGERTLDRFAAELGIAVCTMERYRSVYRAWKEIAAPGPELRGLNYTVARELAGLDDRFDIIKANPAITKKEAQQLRRAPNKDKVAPLGPTAQPAADDADLRTTEWHRKVHVSADKAIKAAIPHLDSWMKDFDAGDFSQIDITSGLLDVVNQAAAAWAMIAECLAQLHQRQRERESVFTSPQPAAVEAPQPVLT